MLPQYAIRHTLPIVYQQLRHTVDSIRVVGPDFSTTDVDWVEREVVRFSVPQNDIVVALKAPCNVAPFAIVPNDFVSEIALTEDRVKDNLDVVAGFRVAVPVQRAIIP